MGLGFRTSTCIISTQIAGPADAKHDPETQLDKIRFRLKAPIYLQLTHMPCRRLMAKSCPFRVHAEALA
jgi:hypothetical protein